ncbi:S-methyl-5-thioribose-1-phosphate isomerase [Fodinisporobacter ferrooxydans]|uniref:Methylthioribose-1-phosphate isomerase n=1 Tax=Fodinisporobacter ferrooxydans TaxID=2901836 RepID=A0ABY4CGP8_9BACL|nr:S-methyl-5-thioribose-1-phosphate isomerase [Alicyclobacillaceae bacterium MYW30-H2]
MLQSLKFYGTSIDILDQTKLPQEERWIHCTTAKEVARCIVDMNVRGAPAIGAAAAYGIAIAAQERKHFNAEDFVKSMNEVLDQMSQTRPTAVNLFWAIERMRGILNLPLATEEFVRRLVDEAEAIAREDIVVNRKIGENGETLIPSDARILTHCNTGTLATVEYGTALGVIRSAFAKGKVSQVYADETRPYLQGARLTAFELQAEHIPVTIVTDSMAGYLMQQNMVDLVIVGADRVASNGDTANKIGTYSLAVLANAHRIPFYVAAPMSTIDWSMTTGEAIEIEQRSSEEVLTFGGQRVAPLGVDALHPAFDVTPHRLITAIITENGVIHRPNSEAMKQLVKA